jgi:uncharacterized protein
MSGWPVVRTMQQWRGVLQPGRVLWLRALLWGFGLIALLVGVGFPLRFLEDWVGLPKQGPLSLVRLALAIAAVLGTYVYAVRLGERRRVDELAPPRLAMELGAGLAFGAVLFSLVMAVLLFGGWYTISGGAQFGPPWTAVRFGLGAGTFEELLFRGVLMRLLWEAYGLGVAISVSSVTFGLAHLLNPQHSLMGALSIIVEAGIMLGALYALTGRLWAAIGAHAGWNFTQGYVFGTDVSGVNAGGHLFHAVQTAGAPILLTGGVFGPEASLPAVLMGATAGASMLIWVWRRGSVVGGAG